MCGHYWFWHVVQICFRDGQSNEVKDKTGIYFQKRTQLTRLLLGELHLPLLTATGGKIVYLDSR